MQRDILLSPIKEMEIRSAKVPGVVSVAQGVPSFDTPDCIKRKAIEAISEGKVARYSLSPGMLELREAIEYDLSKKNIFYDFEKEIIVTAGSIEAITATFLTILNPGDEVLIPDPTYTSYQASIRTARGVPVFVPLDERRGWAFNIEEFKKRITPKTKAILYCNPNNPTGTVYSQSELLQLAELAEIHDLYILSDEVYRDFIYTDDVYTSIAQFSTFRKRFIYIFSFSKTYAMTGWRVAYLATDAVLAEKILGVHDAMVTCAPVVSQWGAIAALEMAGEDVEYFKEEFIKRKKIVCEHLDKLSEWFSYNQPNSAYFVFPKFTDKLIEKLKSAKENKPGATKEYEIQVHQNGSNSWLLALELLYRAKVTVVPGVAFGPSGENHIRMCFGRQADDINAALERIADYVKNF